MTLPYPNSPVTTETINTIISNTKSNIDYLGVGAGVASGLCLKVINDGAGSPIGPATASGDYTVTGVGFEPRLIIFFFSGNYAEWGWGCYTTLTNSYNQIYMRNSSRIVGGTFNRESFIIGQSVICNFYANYDGIINQANIALKSTNSDGFVYTFTNYASNLPLDAYYVVAICFK